MTGTRELNDLALGAGITRLVPAQTELLHKSGVVLRTKAERLARWHSHFCDLFACEGAADVNLEAVEMAATQQPRRHSFTTRSALAALNSKTAAGADGIHVEFLKHGGDELAVTMLLLIERC